MNIYHVEFAKTGSSLSGGEVSMIELIKYFQSKGYKNILLTNDNGKETYVKEIAESKLLEYRTINSLKIERRFGIMISYLLRTPRAIKLVKDIDLKQDDLLICHSDFFPNSIPAWVINRHNPHARSAELFHLKAPHIFKGYEGEFTGHHQFPRPAIIHYQLNQWLYRILTKRNTVIFSVNSYYESFLKKKYPNNRVKTLRSFWGIDFDVKTDDRTQKEYDLIWVGRFHPQKGVKDLAFVTYELAKKKPDIKIIIVGDGPKKAKDEFLKLQIQLGITKNILMAGFVSGSKKFEYYTKSRVFLMPSYYESFGGVTLEAMASGLPVVAYDLPVYEVFKPAIITVPILDYKKMAKEVAMLLNHNDKYDNAVRRLAAVTSRHSWEQTGAELLEEFI
jgi:glycosyltransferase involved in cell wall biosynthesis